MNQLRYVAFLACLMPSVASAGSYDVGPAEASVAVAGASDLSWTGAYAGVQLGFADLEFESSAGIPVWDGSGPAFGFHLGYRHDFGTMVAGLEGEVDFSDIGLDFASGAGVSGSTGQSVKRAARLKAMLGYDAGKLLPYLTAGYSTLSISGAGADYSGEGPVYGFGLSYRVNEKVVLGGEALMHDVEDDLGSNTDYRVFRLKASYSF